MPDGSVIIDTKIDQSGIRSGLASLAGSLTTGMTVAVKAASTALVGLGTYAVKIGSDFEAGMSNVAAISGATGEEIDLLTTKAEEMGAKTKFSASEAADAFSYMAMAGWKTGDMLDGIEGIMSLAAASGEDLASVSDIVTDALTAFGMSAEDSGHFADILAAASSNANTNVGLMGETFKYVAPVTGALGFSAEDTALAIGLMANAGIKGSQAGTALRSVFTRLVKPTKESQEALDALGLSLTKGNGDVKDLNTVLVEMREKFAGLTDAQKSEYAALLAGQEGMSGLLAIINASEEDWNKLGSAISHCTDAETGYSAAAEMAEKQMDNLQGDLTILKSVTDGFAISLYNAIGAAGESNNVLRELVQSATDLVNELHDAVDQNGLGGLAEAVGGVLAKAVAKVSEYAPILVAGAIDLIRSYMDGLISAAPTIANVAAQIGTTLLGGILTTTNQLVQLGAQLVIALANSLSANMPKIVQTATSGLTSLVRSIATYAPLVIDAGIQLIGSLLTGIVSALPQLTYVALRVIDAIINGLFDNADSLIDCTVKIVSGLASALPKITRRIVAVLPRIIQSIVSSLQSQLPVLTEAFIAVMTAITDALPEIIDTILPVLPELVDSIIDGLLSLLPLIVDCGIELFSALGEALPEIVDSLSEAVPEIISGIVSSITSNIGPIADAGFQLLTSLTSELPQVISSVAQSIPGIIAAVADAVMTGLPALSETLTLLVEAGANATSSIITAFAPLADSVSAAVIGVADALPGIIDALTPVLVSVNENLPAIIEAFTPLADTIGAYITDTVAVLPPLVEAVAGLAFDVGTAVSDIITAATPLVTEIGAIITNTITALAPLTTAIGDLVTSVGAAAANIVDSVSGLLIDLGEPINAITGLFTGVGAAIEGILGSVTALAEGIAGGLATVITAVSEPISSLAGLFTSVSDSIVSINGSLGDLALKISGSIQGVLESVGGIFSSIGQAAIDSGTGFTMVAEAATGLANNTKILDLATTLKTIANGITDIRTAATHKKFADGITNIGSLSEALSDIATPVTEISAAVDSLLISISEQFTGMVDEMVTAGYNLMVGVANGIADGSSVAVNAAAQASSAIYDTVRSFFGIFSPSRLFRYMIGKNLMLGLAEGVDDETDTAVGSVERAAEEIASVDFDALAELMTGNVEERRRGLGTTISAGNASQYTANAAEKEKNDGGAQEKPKYVENIINVDGKTAARQLTPYIEKELDWRDDGDS